MTTLHTKLREGARSLSLSVAVVWTELCRSVRELTLGRFNSFRSIKLCDMVVRSKIVG